VNFISISKQTSNTFTKYSLELKIDLGISTRI